jgi:hypothetical protein
MPAKADVTRAVVAVLSGFTGMKPDSIQGAWELKGPPLRFDDNRLAYLAMSLRGYVKETKDGATVKVHELRKSGLTVSGLTELIHGRVK